VSHFTTTLHRGSPGYPTRLADLRDAPVRLHVRGRLDEPTRSVAIVGTRAASGHGAAAARALAGELAAAGWVVISGGAIGIDAAAHRGALDAGGATVAVLASGLDAPYPHRHHPLFDELCGRGGALVTPFEPGVPPRRWHFVRRNRISSLGWPTR
jgi:DNA processing protein